MEAAEWIGTKEEPITVEADEILDAIAKRQDVRVEHAIIKGSLDIGRIKDRLEQDEDGNWVIQGDIVIRLSEILGDVRLSAATFNKDAYFSHHTTFSELAVFMQVNFSGLACFSEATFNEDVYFSAANFSRDANFEQATFNKDVYFSVTTFCGDADFNAATFCGDVGFEQANFSGNAFFIEATFEMNAHFSNTRMKYPANFRGVDYKANTVFAGLWNCFIRLLLYPIVWLLTIGKVRLPKRIVTKFIGFNTSAVMDGSSNPYLKRYINDEQWIASWRYRSWWKRVLFILWELTSHCGRSIGLWMIWSIIIALLFGWLYAAHPTWIEQKMGPLSPWYFSVVTFTTLGFGDLTPKPECWQAQSWIMTEVVLGYIMLGGLISIFANKLARRS